MRDSVPNHLAGESCLCFEYVSSVSVNHSLKYKEQNAIIMLPLNSITFNGSFYTEMDTDSLISRPSTENLTSASFLLAQEPSDGRPPSTTYFYRPFQDAYAVALSSKTILNQAFEQDQASEPAVSITDAKFNSFGCIGRYLYIISAYTKNLMSYWSLSVNQRKRSTCFVTQKSCTVLTYSCRRKPYQKSTLGPKKSSREMCVIVHLLFASCLQIP